MQKSQSELLKEYKSILSNAQHHPLISAAIAEKGYDATKVSEAVKMLNDTTQVAEEVITVTKGKEKVNHDFSNKRKSISDLFRVHRKKIKTCCEMDNLKVTCETCLTILISSKVPKNHTKWVELMRAFYAGLQTPETIDHVKASGITQAIATECLKEIDSMEALKQSFESEKKSCHEVINKKQMAMKSLISWINVFQKAVAPVLADNKMHLEALAIDASSL